MLRSCQVALLLLLVCVVQPASADERGWQITEEYWYAIAFGGANAGWMHSMAEEDKEHYRTSLRMMMRLGRGAEVVEITSSESFIETRNNEPVRMTLHQTQGTEPVTHEWSFGDDTVTHTVTQFGRTRATEHEPPEGIWLTPREVDQFVRKRREAGANEITYRTISPETGLMPFTVTTERAGEDTFTHEDREIPVSVWTVRMDSMPLEITELISTDGYLVQQWFPLGPERIEMTLTTREQALESVTGEPPELVVGLMISPDRPIERPMETTHVTLRLEVRDGEMPELPETASQRVERSEDGRSAIITVKPHDPLPANKDDLDREAYRQPSSLIDFDDEKVRRLIDETLPTELMPDDELARDLQAFVYRYIDNKGLDTAFGSASEVARTQSGDCTEHAVLLAALLRGHDIPARIASGLIYAEEFAGQRDVFGWHMWTQALIDGHWVDLDAVLPGGSQHAAYVLTGVSDLSDESRTLDMAAWVQLIGNLDIEVIDVSHEPAE